MAKPILVSGMQPTGRSHIGNYLGAIKNWAGLQRSGKYSCYWIIVDLHALTENFDPKEKHQQIIELAADYIAAGLDPRRSVVFLQSLVPAHSELGWVFNTVTPIGELERMTQFKDKAERQRENINAGLLTYPTLMAADILLYDPKFVPVGDDQLQHLELTRTIARKFNKRFGSTFVEPKALATPTPRVMGLADPTKKMSKSVPESCLFLDDEPEMIKAKIMRAVTDSETAVRYDWEKKPGISNLLDIWSGLTGEAMPKIEKRFAGKNYGEFKREVAAAIANHFGDFRKRKKALLAKPKSLAAVLKSGSKKASRAADKKMAEVKRRVGIAL